MLQMAVPTGGSLPAYPPCRPQAVRSAVGKGDRPADGCFSQAAIRQPDRKSDGGRHPDGRPPLRPPARRLSAEPTAQRTAASIHPAVRQPSAESTPRRTKALVPPAVRGPTAQRTASFVPRPSAPPSARPSTARMASCLIPVPGSPPPPPHRSHPLPVLSTIEFHVSIKRAAQTPSVCFRT